MSQLDPPLLHIWKGKSRATEHFPLISEEYEGKMFIVSQLLSLATSQPLALLFKLELGGLYPAMPLFISAEKVCQLFSKSSRWEQAAAPTEQLIKPEFLLSLSTLTKNYENAFQEMY